MISKLNISLQSLRCSPWWTAMAVVALITQFGFIAHQLEHYAHADDAIVAEDCIACQSSSFVFDGPDANIATPFGLELESVSPSGQDLSPQRELLKKFQSRAPPKSISV